MLPMPPLPSRPLHWGYLGRIPYAEAVELQLAARDGVKPARGRSACSSWSTPTSTPWARNADEADVLAGPEWLRARGVEVAECDRGGQVTYHGPGQLVGYPIINLSPDRRDIRRYVRDLQQVLIRTLSEYGVRRRGAGGAGVHRRLGRGGEDRLDRRPPLAVDHHPRLRPERLDRPLLLRGDHPLRAPPGRA